ncbi:MAG: hypothetical protein ABSA83_02630 [Verrucomicrobiota bacterium]|jgi:hypothetical protein
MHIALQLLLFWAVSFVTLCAALVLLGIFYGLIENDLELHSVGKEASVAGIASLIEGAGVWLVADVIPAAQRLTGIRALIFPALIVAFIYKIAHLEDWRYGDVVLLLTFQFIISCSGALLVFGRFGPALLILAGFGALLALIAAFAKNL